MLASGCRHRYAGITSSPAGGLQVRQVTKEGDMSEISRMEQPEQEQRTGNGFYVYVFSGGERYEACRPYYEAEKSDDGLDCEVLDNIKDGIRLYLNFGQKPKVVFVRREGSERPEYAVWRADGKTKGRWRTIRFCKHCPDPEVCGYTGAACRLSKSGNPRTAFQPKIGKSYEPDAAPFGGYLEAVSTGQVWLNHVDHAFQVLRELHARVWKIAVDRLSGTIYPNEANFRQRLEERWTAAIFQGRNIMYAVMPWNTDPKQLPTYIIQKYYCEDQASNPEDAPELEGAILGVIEATADAVVFELESMIEQADKTITDAQLQAALEKLTDDATYHTKILLGLPDDLLLYKQSVSPDREGLDDCLLNCEVDNDCRR